MVRSILGGAALIAIGAAAAVLVFTWRSPTEPDPPPSRIASAPRPGAAPLTAARGLNAPPARLDGGGQGTDIKRRLQALGAQGAHAPAQRRRPAERSEDVEALSDDVEAPSDDREEPQEAVRGRESNPPAPAPPPAGSSGGAESDAAAAEPERIIDPSKSAMERALLTVGVDEATAADIKSRHDAVAMSQIYLRDQATREEWLDSPRFEEEMRALEEQRPTVRDEIGDEAYDRYLFEMGQTNRVRVDEVLMHSPAAQVGLQPGDLILWYGSTRLFTPGDLVAETQSGRPGERVRLQISRQGERLELEVARGPLGLQVNATQDKPTAN